MTSFTKEEGSLWDRIPEFDWLGAWAGFSCVGLWDKRIYSPGLEVWAIVHTGGVLLSRKGLSTPRKRWGLRRLRSSP